MKNVIRNMWQNETLIGRWVDGWMGGWVDGWMGGWMNTLINE